METLQIIMMVEAARHEAQRIITEDVQLRDYPLLRQHSEPSIEKIYYE